MPESDEGADVTLMLSASIELPRRNEVHVWLVDLHAEPEAPPPEILSPDELSRAARYHLERDRLRFLLRRGWLRTLLGRYLNVPPRDLQFATGEYGKICLANAAQDLRFNLSHSHSQALFAFAQGREVGVDLEVVSPFSPTPTGPELVEGEGGVPGLRFSVERTGQESGDRESPSPRESYLGIAERFFAHEEVEQLNELSADEWLIGFFNCWTRKEAYLKALGMGLNKSLQEFAVTLKPGEEARLLYDASDPHAPKRWSVHGLDLPEGIVGAVVIEGGEGEVGMIHKTVSARSATTPT